MPVNNARFRQKGLWLLEQEQLLILNSLAKSSQFRKSAKMKSLKYTPYLEINEMIKARDVITYAQVTWHKRNV